MKNEGKMCRSCAPYKKKRQAKNGSTRPFRSAPSMLRSLAAPAVTALLLEVVLELLRLVVLLSMVVDGAGVVCEPAPDPAEGLALEVATEEDSADESEALVD